jgi:hypothetical protein
LNLGHAISLRNWPLLPSVGVHWKFSYALLFSWDVSNIMDSVPAMRYNSGMFGLGLQLLALGNYFAVAMLFQSYHLSQVWVLSLPTTSILQCWSSLMPWGNASSKDGILTCTKPVLIPWGPGGPDLVLDETTDINRNSIHFLSSNLTWDPDGYTQHRLEGKPSLRGGDCQRPHSLLLGWILDQRSWAMACSGS